LKQIAKLSMSIPASMAQIAAVPTPLALCHNLAAWTSQVFIVAANPTSLAEVAAVALEWASASFGIVVKKPL
jgi:hypothetical protein